ncbi:MAG: MOSC domain-containing protein [candidate division KSB1 bacterium]|nr:MOSC domain-containing protein [candidate division KSB1 bacterium]
MPEVVAVCISRRKGTVKKPVPEALFREDHGIEGDAHAGNGHRQVSLLAEESIERIRQRIPRLAYGAFGENVVTRGVDLSTLRVGDRLLLGRQVELEVTQIGKDCHAPCAIAAITGNCIMPREGVFARVLRGGIVHPGDPVCQIVGTQR